PFIKAMEFFALTKRMGQLLDADPSTWPPDPELAAEPPKPIGFDNAQKAVARAARLEAGGKASDATVTHASEVHAAVKAIPIDSAAYETVADAEALRRWIAAIYDEGVFALD